MAFHYGAYEQHIKNESHRRRPVTLAVLVVGLVFLKRLSSCSLRRHCSRASEIVKSTEVTFSYRVKITGNMKFGHFKKTTRVHTGRTLYISGGGRHVKHQRHIISVSYLKWHYVFISLELQ